MIADELKPEEMLICGTEILFKLECPACKADLLCGIDSITCECNHDFSNIIIDLIDLKKRLVAGHVKIKRVRIGKKVVQFLLSMQERLCAYCSILLDKYEIEHIKPLYLGGNNALDNLCISCPECNRLAGAKYFKNFSHKRSYILNKLMQRHK